MSLFELAIRARIPIIGVHTDDLVNANDVLMNYAGNAQLMPVLKGKTLVPYENRLYWTTDEGVATADVYFDLQKKNTSLIVLNPSSSDLIFDTGVLPTPDTLLSALLEESMEATLIPQAMHLLRGVSLKTADHVCRVTVARDGHYSLPGIRKTRTQLLGASQGLMEVDTSFDFYLPPAKLDDWLKLNAEYFLKSKIVQLRPRGVMLDGYPGVGKSTAAKYIARKLDVPLFRMDIASALDKYIGVSEKRVQRLLETVEREAPAVLLIDEVEKIFSASDDGSGTVTRIMSQLLWWLAEHQSRVLTVMTTNAMSKIPTELYREGRVDMTMKILKLSQSEAIEFSRTVLHHLLKKKPSVKQVEACVIAIKLAGKDDFSHIEVRTLVYDAAKQNKWIF